MSAADMTNTCSTVGRMLKLVSDDRTRFTADAACSALGNGAGVDIMPGGRGLTAFYAAPHEPRWLAAGPDSPMVHLAIRLTGGAEDGGQTAWGDPAMDAEYMRWLGAR